MVKHESLRKGRRSFVCRVVVSVGFRLCFPRLAIAATGTLLPQGVGYPRLVRLAHGPSESNGWIIASTTGKIFLSKDDGKTFSFLTDAPAREGSRVRCCEGLYELP